MKPIEQKDILQYTFLSKPCYAPGGQRAAFVASRCDEAENAYQSRLYLYDDRGVHQLTDLGKERDFLWLDEHRLMFPAVRSAAEKKRAEQHDAFTAYYVLDLRGGEALPFFTLPFAAMAIKRVDDTHFAAVGMIDRANPDAYALDDEARTALRKAKEADKDYEVLTELPFWGNGSGLTAGQRPALFLVSTNPMAVRRITGPEDNLLGCDVVNGEVVYAVGAFGRKMAFYGCRIGAVDPQSGEQRTILQEDGLVVNDLLAVDGKVWLFGTRGQRFGVNENDWIHVLDPQTGALTVLREEDGTLYNSVGSDCRYGGGNMHIARGSEVICNATVGGSALLTRLTADGNRETISPREGSVDSFTVCPETDVALLVGLYDMQPQELYACDMTTGQMTQLTHFHADALADRYVAQPQPLDVSSEGDTIHGWVLLPKDYDPAKTYPAVLDVHGGPKTVYGPVFYHEMQVWAGMGCFVFFCNPTGSDGRGNAFADIRGHYGDTDYRNLMDFTDGVLAAYPQIDASRLCETGGSYGGFMTNWIIGHTDRFCCAASQRSIANWLSFYGLSDIGNFFGEDQTAATPWSNPQLMWAHSPLCYADHAATPTLFIHSDEDYRCPLAEGLQMYAALCDHGIEARLCLFHGENHELSRSGKPLHRLRRLREITSWFAAHAAI